MPVPAVPGPGLVVSKPEFGLGGLERVLDRPAPPLDAHQCLDRGPGRAPGREEREFPVGQAAPDQQATRPGPPQGGIERIGRKVSQLQVFTNKPRTVYYFALVTNVKEPNPFDYFAAVLPQALGKDTAHNTFVDQVQAEYGKEFLRVTVEQMREQAGVQISEPARKQWLEDTTTSAPQ